MKTVLKEPIKKFKLENFVIEYDGFAHNILYKKLLLGFIPFWEILTETTDEGTRVVTFKTKDEAETFIKSFCEL